MPTGYTADIAKGITFEQFTLNCARAFGALITMRDDPSDTPIPEEFKPRTEYHDKALKEAKVELLKLEVLTPTEAKYKAKEEYDKEVESRAKDLKENQVLMSKYKAMLKQVRAWKPPTPDHSELKNFMVQQIKSSIDHDGHGSYYENNPVILLSGEDWRKQEIARVKRSITYHTKERKEEVERCQGRTQWVKDLRASLEKGSTE